MSKLMAPAAASARIDPAATTSTRARIRGLEEGALGGYRCKRQSEQSDDPVELCGLRVQVHRWFSSYLSVLSSAASFSGGSRQNLAGNSPSLSGREILLVSRLFGPKRTGSERLPWPVLGRRVSPPSEAVLSSRSGSSISSPRVPVLFLVRVSQKALAKISPEEFGDGETGLVEERGLETASQENRCWGLACYLPLAICRCSSSKLGTSFPRSSAPSTFTYRL